ncbi:MAG: cob(I)yrinic acid a,c-diamide adenosyltransferase [Candidatus Omnitrophota bacterium]|nr:cob(I)yrinic acid a,c-diamide adenosyltransferase [Candidatus Omnitrophota bacterium]
MRKRLKDGLVQVYTGNGKGKTTAALGLALRASGAGLKICFFQFIKRGDYSEKKALANIKNITVIQCGRGCFVKGKPRAKDIRLAQVGLDRCAAIIRSGEYDIVILDEINIAAKIGLVRVKDVIDVISDRPNFVEVVLTGRYCPAAIKSRADLVTNMRDVRHPFRKHIHARRGIEF